MQRLLIEVSLFLCVFADSQRTSTVLKSSPATFQRCAPVFCRDVDDLEDIGSLETYIVQSAAINIFLSHGCEHRSPHVCSAHRSPWRLRFCNPRSADFKSRNCLREAAATLHEQKPLMLTHEADASKVLPTLDRSMPLIPPVLTLYSPFSRNKGGGPLDDIKMELDDAAMKAAIFTETRHVTTWYRIADFQLVSLKDIVEFTLLQCPSYRHLEELPSYVPGELPRKILGFEASKTSTIYVSPDNPGAQSFGAELQQLYPEIIIMDEQPPRLQGDGMTDGGPRTSNAVPHLHLLLYLNVETFMGDAGARLARELRKARAMQLPIVMVHESALRARLKHTSHLDSIYATLSRAHGALTCPSFSITQKQSMCNPHAKLKHMCIR